MHVRLHYPTRPRPVLMVEDEELEVLDLSERGLRCLQDHGPAPRIGARLEGILRLSRGETLPVRGTVVRVSAGDEPSHPGLVHVAAHLDDLGIPRRVILAERQALERLPPRS